MKKSLMLILGILLISGVLAVGFLFKTFNFSFDVTEPITVQHYDFIAFTNQPCSNFEGAYTNFDNSLNEIDTAFPGDSRRLCFKFISQSPNPINITMVTIGNWSNLLQNVSIVNPSPPTLNNPTYGNIDFTVKSNVNGTFNGSIEFRRG
ncbi:MAG: hypothetical protein AABY22_21785 [Nanoarchaeota archaeon]